MELKQIDEPMYWLGNLDDIFEYFYDEDGNMINESDNIIGRKVQLDPETKRL